MPGDPGGDLPVEYRDRTVQGVQMGQDAGRDDGVMRTEVAVQGRGQLRDLRPQLPLGEPCQRRRVAFAGDQRLDHRPPGRVSIFEATEVSLIPASWSTFSSRAISLA